MEQDTEALSAIFDRYNGAQRDALIPLMQEIQAECGHLSRDAVVRIGQKLGLPASKVYGVATFYNQFRFHAPGRFRVQVCRGTACHVKRSVEILEALKRELKIDANQTTRDGLFSLEVVACIGACGLAPVIAIDGEFHANVQVGDVKKILNGYRKMATREEARL